MEPISFTAEEVIKHIKVLSTGKEKVCIEESDRYLKKFQKSKEAWTISNQLLIQSNLSEDIYFFAAKFLRTKLIFDFAQLPIDEATYKEMATLITSYLQKHKNTGKGLYDQLCLAMVDLYMHIYPIWGNLIDHLVKTFGNDIDFKIILLNIMSMIPEEANNKDIVIEETKRNAFKEYLTNNIETNIFQFLHEASLDTNISRKSQYQILSCFCSWVEFTNNNTTIALLAQHSCTYLCFKGLDIPELSEKSAECLCLIIDKFHEPLNQQSEALSKLIAVQIFESLPKCEKVLVDDMIEEAATYLDVFVKFGRRFISMMLNEKDNDALTFLNYMAKFTKLSTEVENLEQLSRFWSKFCKSLRGIKDKTIHDLKIEFYKNLLSDLVKILAIKTALSIDHLEFYDQIDEDEDDDEDDIPEFSEKNKQRHCCKELIIDIKAVIGYQLSFQAVAQQFKEELESFNVNTGIIKWCRVEAILYALKNIIDKEAVSKQGAQLVKELLIVVLQMAMPYTKLKLTAIDLIDKAAPFLTELPELVPDLFRFVSSNLKDKKTMGSACGAISQLCSFNKKFVIANIEDFLACLKQLYGNMHQNDSIVVGLTKAINAQPDHKLLSKYLQLLCQPFATSLVLLLENPSAQNPTTELEDQISYNLNKLSLIVRNLESVTQDEKYHVLHEIFKELWPVLKLLFDKFRTNYPIMERLCKLCKHVMRCLRHLFSEFTIEFWEIITRNYGDHPIPSYLYAVEISVTVFGKSPEFAVYLKKMFDFMCEQTFKVVKDFDENPDLVEDYFGMLCRYIRYNPEIVLSAESLDINLKFADLGIGIQHQGAAKALYAFIECVFQRCNINEPLNLYLMQKIVSSFGESYIKKCMGALVLYPPHQIREYIYDIFHAALEFTKDYAMNWFNVALIPVPEDILTENEKKQFLANCLNYDPNDKKKAEEEWIFFSSRCKQSALRSK